MTARFSDAELEAIRAAVAAAESVCGAEMVPVIEDRADDYESATWVAGAAGAAFALALLAVLSEVTDLLLFWPFLYLALAVLFVGVLCGVLAERVPAVQRLFVPKARMRHEVDRAATQAFVQQGVSETSDRMGLLIYFSLFERTVELLPDVGLRELATAEEWDTLVQTCLAYFREKTTTAVAIAAAIAACGQFVQPLYPPNPTTQNELDDDLRYEEN